MSRITYAELESENKKLTKANAKLQKELEKATEQVEELRASIDERATKDAENANASETLDLCSDDLGYEHRRRIVAENRAYALEQKVLSLVNTFLPLEERRKFLSHLRLNGDGKPV